MNIVSGSLVVSALVILAGSEQAKPLNLLHGSVRTNEILLVADCAGRCQCITPELASYFRGEPMAPRDREALKLWVSARADGGDAKAEFAMGESLKCSERHESIAWYRKSAAQGYPAAEVAMAGRSSDPGERLNWLRKAASQGSATGMYLLGWRYAAGPLVARDEAAAARLFLQAARQGQNSAATALGNLYATGAGVPMNESRAIFWFRKQAPFFAAAEYRREIAEALYERGDAYETGDSNLFRNFDKNDAEAMRFYRMAADRHHPQAEMRIGRAFVDGWQVQKDPTKALDWYRRAARDHSHEAAMALGEAYELGIGTPRNVSKAMAIYLEADAVGDWQAGCRLDVLARDMFFEYPAHLHGCQD